MKYNDEQLINAILTNGSINQTAKALGISHSSISNRMKKPEFAQKLNEAKTAYLQQAVQELRQELKSSVKTLAEVRDDKEAPQSVRIQAADTILRHALKYTEIGDIIQRIEELEKRCNDV